MVSRAWRLLPVFWLTGALAIGVAVYLRSSVPVTPHVIVSDVAILGYASLRGYSSSLPAAWSLDLEIQFYLLAPLLLTALYRLKQRGMLAVWIIGGLSGALFLLTDPAREMRMQSDTVLPCLVFFMIGVGCAVGNTQVSNRLAAFSGMGTLAAIALFTTAPILRGILLRHGGDAAFYQQHVCSGLLAILAAPYAMWTVRRPHNRLDKPMGDWSYIVYLFHGPVIALYMAATDGIPRLEKLPILAAVLCFIAGGTWVIWRWFDREIDRRREIFVNKRRLSI